MQQFVVTVLEITRGCGQNTGCVAAPTGGKTHVDMWTKSKKEFTKNTFCFNICAHSKWRNWLNGPIWKNIASSYLAAFVVCGGIIIYNTSAPWILIITNSHQNMALILESVCKFKYDIILGVISFPDARQAEWHFYYLHVFKDEGNLSVSSPWWTAGGETSSSQTSLNFDMNINEVHIDSCSSCCKWNGASWSGRFLNSNRSVNICFRPPSLVSAVTPTEFLMRLSSRDVSRYGDRPHSCSTWPPCCGHLWDSPSSQLTSDGQAALASRP